MSPVAEIQFMCMGYLNFWHALTLRNATAKKTTVNSIISASCMRGLPFSIRTAPVNRSMKEPDSASIEFAKRSTATHGAQFQSEPNQTGLA